MAKATAAKITGVPSEAKKAKVRATAKSGGKPGSARSNQSVKLSDADKAQVASEAKARLNDVIDSVKGTTSGSDAIVVTAAGRDAIAIKTNRMTAELRKLAVVGGSYKAVRAAYQAILESLPPAKMARGVDSHNSPQTAKAVADAAGRGNPAKAPKAAPAKVAKEAKKAARKAERAAKAAPKGDDTRAITIVKKDFAFGREGTARRASWDKALKAKTVAAYIAAGGAAKYLPRWVSAGAIKLG